MAKLNKAKTVGEDSVVFTEIDKIVIEIISTIGLMGWNADEEAARSPLEHFVDNGFNDNFSQNKHYSMDTKISNTVSGNCDNSSDDDFAELESKPCASLNQMLELIRETPITTMTSKFCFSRRDSENGFVYGDFDRQLTASTKEQNQQNIHKRKALDQPLAFREPSLSPVLWTSYDSDVELDKALKRAKLEHYHFQKILLKEQIEEKRLQNQLLQIEIRTKKGK